MPVVAVEVLRSANPPWFLLLIGTPAAAHEFSWSLNPTGLRGIVLRGSLMESRDQLFNEFAAALQFPDYFGHNWNALEECLTDLAWLPAPNGHTLIIVDPARVLVKEPTERFELLRELLQRCARAWAAPVDQGEPWDRAPMAFHIVLQVDASTEEAVRTRWSCSAMLDIARGP